MSYRTYGRDFALILLILGAIRIASAQDGGCPACLSEKIGYVPEEILTRPLPLREGIGMVNEPVTTVALQARAYFEQGEAYLHSYVWVEAARSFNQALRLDPKLAMGHIGLSRAYSGLNDPKAARAEQKQAAALAEGASAWEKRRIALRGKQLDAMEDEGNEAKHLAYKRALDDALAIDLNDAELWCLRGNAEEESASGRGQRGGAASTAFYLRVMQIVPDHFGAHHYLVHSYESINQIDKALEHGAVYARLAPNVPHARHMYGHDLRRVGRVKEAIAEFTKALELEQAYYAAEKIAPEMDWHHQHNLDLLAGCYQHEGQLATAERIMKDAYELPAPEVYREFQKKEWPAFLISRGRNWEALAEAEKLEKSATPAVRAAGAIQAGHALAAMGDLSGAGAKFRLASRTANKLPQKGGRITSGSLKPSLDLLRGELALRSGKRDEARPILEEVQRKLRAQPGPDAWSQALFRLESIAKSARAAGDWDLAEFTAKQMIEHDKAYGGSHYAMALVEEHKGETDAAGKSFAEAARLWSGADFHLPELKESKVRIATAKD